MIPIKVIDSPMGAGKTSYLIKHMKNAPKDNKFLFITPFLDEVTRIISSCKERKFVQPTNNAKNGSKLESLKKLITKGRNVVSTHALFSMADEELITLLKSQNYTLVLDEVMDVVESVQIKQCDIEMLFNENYITIDEEDKYKRVIWCKENYNGRFNDVKIMCDNNCLFYVNETLLVWSLPVNVFKAFTEIYISTYMFYAQIQKYYYDYFDMEYEYYNIITLDNEYFIMKTQNNNYDKEFRQKAKALINIIDNEKLNAIGDCYGQNNYETALSKTWYMKNKNTPMMKMLKNNLVNFFINYCKDKSELNMWTTYKDYKDICKGKGYTKGFIPLNSRATNQYSHKKNCAYVVNRYLNPFYKAFFDQRDIKIDEDRYALSEMLQWIWRSAIRNGEEINLYIPSVRMRKLLIDFLNENLSE